jgi:hypothetical protein
MVIEGQKIRAKEGDAPEFIEMVNTIMGLLVFQYGIKEVVFVKIKNWFDHKWLNYSGKSVVPFESAGALERDAALQDEWREQVTIPPFHPNRVIYSKFFQKQPTDNVAIKRKLHRFRASNDNLHNRVEDYTKDGLLIWFSSHSAINQRGSLMIYRVQNQQVHTWYASMELTDGWKVTRTKGIALSELKGYIK